MRGSRNHAVLVSIEGCDGAGKSTITPLLSQVLTRRGYSVCCINPKRPPVSELDSYSQHHLQTLANLLWNERDKDGGRNQLPDLHWVALSGAWFAAIDQLIVRPALSNGGIVLLDSWYTKLLARFSLKSEELSVHADNVYSPIIRPTVGFLLDVDPEVAADRKKSFGFSECGHFDGLIGRTRDNFVLYQNRVRQALLRHSESNEWVIINTHKDRQHIVNEIADKISAATKVKLNNGK